MGLKDAIIAWLLDSVRVPTDDVKDMVETAENVWSDSCVCAMTDKDLKS